MTRRTTSWSLAFVLLSATAISAQDQGQSTQQPSASGPIQPLGSGPGNANPPAAAGRGMSLPYQSQPNDASQARPDENTLAGAQISTPGSFGGPHNIFDPSISVSELAEASLSGSRKTIVNPVTVASGTLNFERQGSRSNFIAYYNGGDTLANNTPLPTGPFHNLTVTEQLEWARWHLLLRDDFGASSGALFGGSGTGGPGLLAQLSSTLGSSLASVGQQFIPSDTIGTGSTMRYRNAVLGQAEYSLTRKTTFTISGSYGLLHFNDNGYISSHMVNAQAGIDHEFDGVNSIAILGGYGKSDYVGTLNSTSDYMGQVAYGRKITGRLAFQLAAGAQQIRTMRPTGNFQSWESSVNTSLNRDWRRGGISLDYSRGLTSGSGAFFGATSNTVSSSGRYQFTRFWTGSVNGGYSLNKDIAPAGAASSRFDIWFAGANLGRQLGLHALVNFSYGIQRQNSPSVCPVASCGVSGSLQTAGMTLNWHFRRMGG